MGEGENDEGESISYSDLERAVRIRGLALLNYKIKIQYVPYLGKYLAGQGGTVQLPYLRLVLSSKEQNAS